MERRYRIVTFLPATHAAENFVSAINRVHPLGFGNYDSVAWWSAQGTEQFRPLPGATPAQGKIGETERAASVRIEFSIPADDALLNKIIEHGIRPHHPWEEPVISVYACLEPISGAKIHSA